MQFVQLISTSNEEKINDNDIIYLGNWCKNDDYIIKDHTVASYHWDDRNKLEKDNYYINDLYEKLLKQLSLSLNELHSKSYSENYWRIAAGYWLFYYLSVNFDRWENINSSLNEFKEINFYQSINISNQPIAKNTREFMNLASDVKWNHFTYTKIINFLIKKKNINIRISEKKYNNEPFYYNYKPNIKHKIKTVLIKLYVYFFKKKIKKNKIILFKTYLGLINENKINFKLKQLPIIFLNKNLENKINFKLRDSLKLHFDPKNSFEEFIIQDIFKSMPSELLENYETIEDYIQKSELPDNPSLIVSTRALATDNIFVRYIAKKKENGCKLIYAQHGGVYGHIKFHWSEDHEIKISDRYLTWGWKKESNKKVIPFYLMKNINEFSFKKSNNINNLCYFVRSRPKYTGRIDGSTGSNQMAKYYKNCLKFAKDLKDKNNFNIVPRFHEAQFEWNHIDIWRNNNFNKFSFTDKESLDQVYKNYELLIYSYIGTGFLESIALNKPFILISSLLEWPLRNEVIKDFDDLEKAKIFFRDNNDAKLHLKKIYNNINDWWDNTETMKVKNYFKEKYARIDINDRRNEHLYNLINDLKNNEK